MNNNSIPNTNISPYPLPRTRTAVSPAPGVTVPKRLILFLEGTVERTAKSIQNPGIQEEERFALQRR